MYNLSQRNGRIVSLVGLSRNLALTYYQVLSKEFIVRSSVVVVCALLLVDSPCRRRLPIGCLGLCGVESTIPMRTAIMPLDPTAAFPLLYSGVFVALSATLFDIKVNELECFARTGFDFMTERTFKECRSGVGVWLRVGSRSFPSTSRAVVMGQLGDGRIPTYSTIQSEIIGLEVGYSIEVLVCVFIVDCSC